MNFKHRIGNCGITINIPDTDSGVTVIRIEGNQAVFDKASKELHGMVEKMENEREKDLIIKIRLHRQLIGPSGENRLEDQEGLCLCPDQLP